MEQERERIRIGHLKCPYCHAAIFQSSADNTGCEQCTASHHTECWDAHGGCSACGYRRPGAPPRRRRRRPPRPRRRRRHRPGAPPNLPCARPECSRPIATLAPKFCQEHLREWERDPGRSRRTASEILDGLLGLGAFVGAIVGIATGASALISMVEPGLAYLSLWLVLFAIVSLSAAAACARALFDREAKRRRMTGEMPTSQTPSPDYELLDRRTPPPVYSQPE